MGFRRPFYTKGRLKVAWALPTDSVCGNDGKRYGVFLFSWAKPSYDFPFVPNRELQVGLTVFALSLALSHGEREQIAGNRNNS